MKQFAYLALIGSVTAIRSADDINNDIGTYAHQKTRGYASPYTTSGNFSPFWDENHIMPGTHITIPRDEHDIQRNSALAQVRVRDDINNDIGTYAHQKTRGYASPYTTSGNFSPFWDENHIMPGTHITIPRDEHDIQRNSALAQARSGDDINNDIGTYAHQKTRGYASPYTTSGNFSPFWDENHIMPGTHITIPRDEHHIMRNSALMQKSRREPYSNELANGDKSDDKELEKENDPNDFAVDLHGHTDRGYGSEVPSDYFDKNHIMPGTHITIPRDETAHDLGNNVRAQMNRMSLSQMRDIYSNELANGDRDDDKELEKENDPNDAIVDYNGHTNRGYGSQTPTDFFDINHIMPGSMITVPRDETVPGLGNSLAQRHSLRHLRRQNLSQMGDIYSNELANGDRSDDKEIEDVKDTDDFIVDYNGQTNRGYGSAIPTTYFQNNKIMAGTHVTVPRDEGDQPLRNS